MRHHTLIGSNERMIARERFTTIDEWLPAMYGRKGGALGIAYTNDDIVQGPPLLSGAGDSLSSSD